MKKCGYADKYRAKRAPKCNGGKPCDACQAKWDRRNRTPMIDSLYARWAKKYEARKEEQKRTGRKPPKPIVRWVGKSHAEKTATKKTARAAYATLASPRLREHFPKDAAAAYHLLQQRKVHRDMHNVKVYEREARLFRERGFKVRLDNARVFAASYTGAELLVLRAERGVGRPPHLCA